MGIRIFLLLTILTFTYQRDAAESSTAPIQTSFSCEGRVTGYYADLETGCRTYHLCTGSQQYTYECPNNTLFQQRIFICNHWYLVDCSQSELFYSANLLIGQRDKPFVGESETPLTSTLEVAAFDTGQRTQMKSTTPSSDESAEDIFSALSGERDEMKEMTPPATPSKTKALLKSADDANGVREESERYIRLKFADSRGLFYIPNGNNSAEMIPSRYREFVIPRLTEVEVMHFKRDERTNEGLSCPKFCDLRYVQPGTCHPCITIR